MTIADEIERLENMRRDGVLSEEEFQEAKSKALQENNTQSSFFASATQPDRVFGMHESKWCLLMHLSQLLTVSVLGILVPILMWIFSREENEEADWHGTMIFNWLLSCLIYFVVCLVLMFAVIGFPMMLFLFALMFIFPIIGAIKANQGERWRYPCTIEFF